MKPNEWAAIIFGIAGFTLSLISLMKSVRGDRRAKRRELAGKRVEALVAIRDAESEVCAAQRDFIDLRKRAASNTDRESENLATEMIETLDRVLSNIDIARTQAQEKLPPRNYDKIYEILDSVVVEMRDIADGARIKERRRALIEGEDEIMSLRAEIQELIGQTRMEPIASADNVVDPERACP